MSAAEPKICKLQVNHKGSWRDVMEFDADENEEQVFHHAAELFG